VYSGHMGCASDDLLYSSQLASTKLKLIKGPYL